MEVLITIFGIVALVVFSFFYGSLTWGLVVYKFWYWFLLPVFTGLPHITFIHAVGIGLFIGLFRSYNTKTQVKKEYKDDSFDYMLLVYPWIVLFIGWIIHLVFY